MAWKTKIDGHEYDVLDESHKDFYRPLRDGSFVANIENIDNLDSLLSAFNSGKEELKALRARLEILKDASPEGFAQMQARYDQSQANLKAIDDERGALEKQHADELAALREQLAQTQKGFADERAGRIEDRRQVVIARAIHAHKGSLLLAGPQIDPHVVAFRDETTGEVTVAVKDGDSVDPPKDRHDPNLRQSADGTRLLTVEEYVGQRKLLEPELAVAFPRVSTNGYGR